MTDKYQSRSPGRPYAEIRGYLRGALTAATVAADVLTPASQDVAVFSLNAAGVWRYKCEAKVWNYDETLTADEGVYVRAALNDDQRFEIFWVGCEPSELTIPTSPV